MQIEASKNVAVYTGCYYVCFCCLFNHW